MARADQERTQYQFEGGFTTPRSDGPMITFAPSDPRPIAQAVGDYRKALAEAGFPASEVTNLVIQYHTTLLAMYSQPPRLRPLDGRDDLATRERIGIATDLQQLAHKYRGDKRAEAVLFAVNMVLDRRSRRQTGTPDPTPEEVADWELTLGIDYAAAARLVYGK